MRRVSSGREPPSLVQHQARAGHYTDVNFPKQEVEQELCQAQSYRCAYCNGPIEPGRMTIEHWAPQAANPELDIAWSNLLGACLGNKHCNNELYKHCDSSKGNFPLHLHPKQPGTHILFRFPANAPNRHRFIEKSRIGDQITTDLTSPVPEHVLLYNPLTGEILSDNEDYQDDIQSVLRLNQSQLCEKRLELLQQAKGQARRDWTSGEFERAIQHYRCQPYGVAAVWWLQSRIRKA